MRINKLSLVAASFLAALSANGQGTVDFNNFFSESIENLLTGMPVTASDGVVVQLYWSQTSGGFFGAVGTPVVVGEAFGTPFPGYFGGGILTVPGVTPPGAAAFFEVRAWETAYGATYEAAVAAGPMNGRGPILGHSTKFMSDTGNPLATPPDLPGDLGALIDFSSGPLIPEPSVIALSLLGAGIVSFFRRRK